MNDKVRMNPKLEILIPVVKGLAKILGKDYERSICTMSRCQNIRLFSVKTAKLQGVFPEVP